MTEVHDRPEWPSKEFEGFIFDCDGTLADSMPAHFRAWRDAFAANGARFEFTWEAFYGQAGMGMHESVEYFNNLHSEALAPENVIRTYLERMAVEHQHVRAIEPVVALARTLARTHPVSVASGGSREHVQETLRLIGLTELFSVVITKDDVERGKPAPDTFLLAAQEMGVAPERCLVFEDGKLGIEAAEIAGMQVIYIDPHFYSTGV